MMVRRKGRPISQCDACREQRIKRQIHQKCVCIPYSDKPSFRITTRHIMSIESLLSKTTLLHSPLN